MGGEELLAGMRFLFISICCSIMVVVGRGKGCLLMRDSEYWVGDMELMSSCLVRSPFAVACGGVVVRKGCLLTRDFYSSPSAVAYYAGGEGGGRGGGGGCLGQHA